jgi:hypothetical protein
MRRRNFRLASSYSKLGHVTDRDTHMTLHVTTGTGLAAARRAAIKI